ncbi:hypothetical protein BN59_01563 [Legionella massiliensis]|uniref:Uncharacterized protein n=1 Tax=Legionella massiliensis TaxID=1034943 RepID=A0A078KWA7_9GAMM|nr:hypothetical protein BN59_01563 [Legionella massiliensis]CEE13019.1 hypothetical protein BN1094_01563 [Legionella massiliensis]
MLNKTGLHFINLAFGIMFTSNVFSAYTPIIYSNNR